MQIAMCTGSWPLLKERGYEDYNNVGKREPDFHLLDRQGFFNNIEPNVSPL